jgi:hypothetical protein
MAKAASQKSLDSWTKQKWRTKSGKPSTKGTNKRGFTPEELAEQCMQKVISVADTAPPGLLAEDEERYGFVPHPFGLTVFVTRRVFDTRSKTLPRGAGARLL